MLPTAVVTYTYTQSIPLAIVAFVLWPLFGMMQGTILILHFRHAFGKSAPLPRTPTHGLVVVHPKDSTCTSTTTTITATNNNNSNNNAPAIVSIQHSGLNNQNGCSCPAGCRWRQGLNLTKNDEAILQQALQHDEPLRLLVMGDSLALGVGVHESCTALLPEALAKTLSKQMNGRPVYWTCHGSPGASAGWIVRELERGAGYQRGTASTSTNLKTKESFGTPGLEFSDSSSEDSSVESSSSELLANSKNKSRSAKKNNKSKKNSAAATTPPKISAPTDKSNLPEWRRRLANHRQSFDPNMKGPYDIVVIMTGPNDVKSAVLPFLVHKDEAELRKDATSRGGGGGLTSELERVLETLGPKMSASKTGAKLPLVVFPGMPTALLPIFQQLPIRWMAIPVSGIMDQHKVDLSNKKQQHSNLNVMYVKPPSVTIATDFEAQRGPYWTERLAEDTLLALRDVTRDQCEAKIKTMRSYYEQKTAHYKLPCYPASLVTSQANVPNPPLSERRGRDGSKIVCMDNVHPNDEGYDMWGRHIAHGILEQLAL